ncbi:hypothetical protein [Kalamiella sp. sgz302252]|uniref:hypothetical protein n=1 Tax=Pantoea sp. sgz302252 TaxID=3341827 RepID=UPI0036D21B09
MNVNNQKTLPFFFYLSAAVFLYILSRTLHPVPDGDDAMFSRILDGKNIFSLLQQRYFGWSGRIPIELLLIKTINIKLFWKIAIPASVLLLAYTAWRAFFFDIARAYLAVPAGILLFMLITPSVNADAAWWLTGFYNYLLPVALGSWSLLIVKNSSNTSIINKVLALLLLSISCFSEQVAVLMITGSVSIYFFKKDKKSYDLLFIALCLACTAILLTAPGNAQRFAFEVKNSLPEFADFNLVNKLTLGVDRLNHHLNDSSNLIINALMLLALINVLKEKNIKITDIIAISFLFIKLCGFLLSHLNSGLIDFIYNESYFNAQSWFGYKIYTSYFFTLAAVFSLAYLSYNFILNKKFAIAAVISLLAGCATVMMMSFSPTVYASAQRILFTYEICSLITVCIYIRHFTLLFKSR